MPPSSTDRPEPAGQGNSAPGVAFIDGAYCPVGEAKISILDWGLLRSDATYDVVSVWHGSFFRLEDHLDRFMRSVAGLCMSLPHSREEVRSILIECVRRSSLRDVYVEMACTRGLTPKGVMDPRQLTNRFFAFAIPYRWIFTPEQQECGVSVVISPVLRIPSRSIDPRFKNYQWGDFNHALIDAYDREALLPLLADLEGNITEAPGANVFAVIGGRVISPARGVLEGITRRTVMELCADTGIPAQFGSLPTGSLRQADEIFLTSTAGGVMPVSRLDGCIIGDGGPGPVATRIRALYWSKREAGWYATPADYDN